MASISNTPITLPNGVFNYKLVPVPNTSYSKVLLEDGTVAVLIHCGYGGGWSTGYVPPGKEHQYIFDSRIILYVLSDEYKTLFNSRKQITSTASLEAYDNLMNSIFPDEISPGPKAFSRLVVKFIPENTQFRITEYDGAEAVEILDLNNYMSA